MDWRDRGVAVTDIFTDIHIDKHDMVKGTIHQIPDLLGSTVTEKVGIYDGKENTVSPKHTKP